MRERRCRSGCRRHPPSRNSARMPYAAATDRRFITAAVAAITMLRNATTRSSIDTTTTPMIMNGNRSTTEELTSIVVAVLPPTCAWTPVASVASGITSLRTVCTRSTVASSCGPVDGMTVIRAVSPAGLSRGGETEATPAAASSDECSRSRDGSPAASRRSATMSNGPLVPGPKPSASMSYPCRADLSPGSLPASGSANWAPRKGTASTRRRAMPPAAASALCRCTNLLHRTQPRAGTRCPSAEIPGADRRPTGKRRRSIHRPR